MTNSPNKALQPTVESGAPTVALLFAVGELGRYTDSKGESLMRCAKRSMASLLLVIAVGCGETKPSTQAESTASPAPICKLASADFARGVLGFTSKVGYVQQSPGVWYVVADGFPEGNPQAWSIWATASDPSADPYKSGVTFPATNRARERSEIGADRVPGQNAPSKAPAANAPSALRVGYAADDLTSALVAARACVDLLA